MTEQEGKQTVVELLFLEFKTLATNMRFAGDESGAGLIDFLCEREVDALKEEQEQLQKAYEEGYGDALNAVDSIINKVTKIKQDGIN
jgi:membrane-anchored protein YejM (alkaline phosphatase superfamily)